MLVLLAAVLGPAAAADFAPPKWVPQFVGIDHADLTASAPRPLKAQALKIDLTADGVAFLATPGGPNPGRTLGLKTTSFLVKHRVAAAINAAPYKGPHDTEGKDEQIVGLHISGGTVVSGTAESKAPALMITKDNRARIGPPTAAPEIHTAVAGFYLPLEKGKVIATDTDKHPRTAVGLSGDGKTMYWLVVDGRRPGVAEGVTGGELGALLKALGAADGLNLDGGGTTTMAVEDGAGKARLLNTPVHGGKPGTERVAGSHLGVFAKPLPK